MIKSWLEQGFTSCQIYQLLKNDYSKATVYRWVNRILISGVSAKTSPGRPRSARTKLMIAKVKRYVLSNKKRKPARRIAREVGISARTIRRIIQKDLGLKAYKQVRVPALTSAHIRRRKSFSHWIRNRYTKLTCRNIMFSDEKWFNQDGLFNRQNDRVYAPSRSAANESGGLREEHKHPFQVMVWVGLTFHGPTRPIFLPEETSFNSDFYIEKVLPKAKEDGIRLIGPEFVFQQDGAKPHTSKDTVKWLDDNDMSFIRPKTWPPNSPDLNPLDFFYWNEVEKRIDPKSFTDRRGLIEKIKKAMNEIPLKMIQDAIDDFRSRVYAVEKNSGGLILNKYY